MKRLAVAGAVSAQPTSVSGTVEFEGGAVIPEGEIEIYIEDPAIREAAQRRAAETHLKSDGGSRTMDFALSPPTGSTASPGIQVVARLERADGWLLARGSVNVEVDSPVVVTLHMVAY